VQKESFFGAARWGTFICCRNAQSLFQTLPASLKVEDVAPHGLAIDRATVRQKKTGHPVRFELTEQTREAVDD